MTSFFAQLGALVSSLAGARPDLPADVAPPVPLLLGGTAVVLIVVGIIVLLIVLVAIRALRRIRQENTPDQED